MEPKKRTLRRFGPDKTRKGNESYKVDLTVLQNMNDNDILPLNLCDENDPDNAIITILLSKQDIVGRNSLHFSAVESSGKWEIKFHGDFKTNHIEVNAV